MITTTGHYLNLPNSSGIYKIQIMKHICISTGFKNFDILSTEVFQYKYKDFQLVLLMQLELHTSIAGGIGLIPGWGTEILQAMQHSQKNKL